MNHTQLQMLLAAYSQLDEADRRLVDAHVLQCTECATQLRAYQQMEHRLGRLVDEQIHYATRHVISPAQAQQPAFVIAKRLTRTAWLDNLVEKWRPSAFSDWQLAGVGTMLIVLAGFLLTLTEVELDGVATTIDSLLEKAEPAQPTPISSTDKVTITFACHHSSCDWFKEQAQVFQQQQPYIEVVVKEKGEFSSIATAGRSLDEAFPAIAASVDSGEWWQLSSGVRNLRPFIQTDPTFPTEDYFPAAQQYMRNDFVAGLPVNLMPPLVVFDKTLFDAAGTPYPRLDWRLADLYEAARQTTVKRGADCCIGFADSAGLAHFPSDGGLYLFVTGDLTNFLRQQQSETPTQLMQVLADALQRYADLVEAGATPNWVKLLAGDVRDTFLPIPFAGNQRPAMWTELLAGESTAESRYPGSRYGFVPLPQEMKTGFALRLGNVYYISAQSQHPQESWLWLRFLSAQVNPHDIAPPARRSTAESHYFNRRGWDADQVAALREALQQPGLTVEEGSMAFSAIRGTINSVIESVLKGQSVAEALDRMKPRLEQEINTWQTEQKMQVVLGATPTAPGIFAPAGPPPTPTPAGNTTVTFGCPSMVCSQFRELAEQFERLYPAIAIQVVGVQPGLSARELSKAADVLAAWQLPVTNLTSRENFANLRRDFIDQDGEFDVNDYYAGALELYHWEDGLWMLPSTIEPLGILYDKAAFAQAGLPPPTLNWTREEFLATARQLTQRQGDSIKRYGFANTFDEGMAFLAGSLREAIAPTPGGAPAPTANEQIRAGIGWYIDLARKEQVMPATLELARQAPTAMWLTGLGNALMWPQFMALAGQQELTVGLVPLPGVDTYPLIGGIGPVYLLSKEAKHPGESWLWLKFLTKQRIEKGVSPGQSLPFPIQSVPARRSVAATSGYWNRWDSADRAVMEYVLAHADPKPWGQLGWQRWGRINQSFTQIADGINVDEALAWLEDCPDPRSAILEPAAGAVISGTVALFGVANTTQFQFYKLEYATGHDPAASFTYLGGANTPVLGSGQLGTWDTTMLANGDYTLLLTVVGQNGNSPAQCRVPVRVRN